jgi:hypothetical protein
MPGESLHLIGKKLTILMKADKPLPATVAMGEATIIAPSYPAIRRECK